MKKNYASLLNQITELYIKALSQMYFWDSRCDNEKDGDNAQFYCSIRNEYAHKAAAYFDILSDEVSQDDIEDMHRTAKQTANLPVD